MYRETPDTPQTPQTLGVDDPEEYIQRRRIKSILDAKEGVLEARQRAMDLFASGKVDEQLSARIVKEAVERYVFESEQTIKKQLPGDIIGRIEPSDLEDMEPQTPQEKAAFEAWFAAPIGTIRPDMGTVEGVEGVELYGIRDFMQSNDPIRFTVETTDTHPVRGRVSETRVEEQFIPTAVSMQAFECINNFWSEMGMDVIVGGETDDHGEPF